jgi:hypothetical protein
VRYLNTGSLCLCFSILPYPNPEEEEEEAAAEKKRTPPSSSSTMRGSVPGLGFQNCDIFVRLLLLRCSTLFFGSSERVQGSSCSARKIDAVGRKRGKIGLWAVSGWSGSRNQSWPGFIKQPCNKPKGFSFFFWRV